MSRIAKAPITVAKGIDLKIDGQKVTVKGGKGSMELAIHPSVSVKLDDGVVTVTPADDSAWAMAGTMRSLIANMVQGCGEGFQKKLQLVGVGYRAQAKGKTLNLSLGFSHPIDYPVPEGITIETPSQTEIVVSGADKQVVGQVASEIRSFRPPEPYKGKGVRYADERIVRKEAKKK
ncbi:MAG: 50S ribosomal protein L6 [Chromatiaceae bacterium]|jgi:large subunit ribosomal protein L6